MTIIAAYDDGQNYWIGSDSMGFGSGTMYELGSKLISKGNYLIGFSWSYRVADIIRECDDFPIELSGLPELRKIRDIIKERITEDDLVGKNDADHRTAITRAEGHPVDLVLAAPSGLYTIECDYQIHKIPNKGYTATGSGCDFALGALYTAKQQKLNGRTAIQNAVKSAIKHCSSCGGKCHIKSMEKKYERGKASMS